MQPLSAFGPHSHGYHQLCPFDLFPLFPAPADHDYRILSSVKYVIRTTTSARLSYRSVWDRAR